MTDRTINLPDDLDQVIGDAVGPCCRGCIYHRHQVEGDFHSCRHPEYDQEVDQCPGRFELEDAKAEWRSRDDY